jgi:hypothetical protein
MADAMIVVQATTNSSGECETEILAQKKISVPIYHFKAGERGILELDGKGSRWRLYTYVIWDGDPDKQARPAFFDEVKVVGLQIDDHRMLLQSR